MPEIGLDPVAMVDSGIKDSIIPYTYEPLPKDADFIRLMHLEPALDSEAPLHFTFTSNDIGSLVAQYEAISYTWGEPKLDYALHVNGSSTCVMVTKNLDSALRKLRHSKTPRILWADAVCINQSDNEEKSRQIPLMTKIFRGASRVLAWLDGGADEEKGMQLLNKWSRDAGHTIRERSNGQSKSPAHDVAQETDSIHRLLDLAWFSRLWIIQEVVMNADVVLICGSCDISWFRFSIGLSVYRTKRPSARFIDELEALQRIYQLWKHYNTFSDTRMRRHEAEDIEDICDLVQTFSSYKCTDPRDRIFAMYSMTSTIQPVSNRSDRNSTNEALQIMPEDFHRSGSIDVILHRRNYVHDLERSLAFYKTIYMDIDYTQDIRQVYQTFAAACIKSDRTPFVLESLLRRRFLQPVNDWPSWVPDWRVAPTATRWGYGYPSIRFKQVSPDIVSLSYSEFKSSTHRFIVDDIIRAPTEGHSRAFVDSLRTFITTWSGLIIELMAILLPTIPMDQKECFIADLAGLRGPTNRFLPLMQEFRNAMRNQCFFIATSPTVTSPLLGYGSTVMREGDELVYLPDDYDPCREAETALYDVQCYLHLRRKGTHSSARIDTHFLLGTALAVLAPGACFSSSRSSSGSTIAMWGGGHTAAERMDPRHADKFLVYLE
ncbi:hypothetical protein HBI56_114100 [Parastagonospora nodorum]|nr:hypothetical protein HBI09_073540 [Parastagonospora nodorum]KAH4052104.1 hypothetical protein HBH49_112080 [Parastagonospora nodorum]KAH4068033.1 hypothetical protein HBH50_121650 [Parastagonospora nodorum]KAH4085732.1 hypothetical protein HBH48_153510 [Parastagonospora nodorum]KAH4102926.1 hypothetical protein HBH46_122080 [Parastagonospora nodorum]